jgi:hypothetical protein
MEELFCKPVGKLAVTLVLDRPLVSVDPVKSFQIPDRNR